MIVGKLKKKHLMLSVTLVIFFIVSIFLITEVFIAKKFVQNSSIQGLVFCIPEEIDKEKEMSEKLTEILDQVEPDMNIENVLKDFVVYEESDTNYSIIKMGQFDLLAFNIDGVSDVTEFKTVKEFTDRCYIGDISLTQRGETKTAVTKKASKQIFEVAIGVIQTTPQYTEDMFVVDTSGEYSLNEEIVDKAIEEGTLTYKPEYIETNMGYLSLISNMKTGDSYGVLVGYSVNDDKYQKECKYISENLDVVTSAD